MRKRNSADSTAQQAATARVPLEGDLTVSRAAELHDEIKKAVASAREIVLEFGEVQAADLSVFQLVCSAHRTASLQPDKALRIAGSLPASLSRLAGETCQCIVGRERQIDCLWGAR